VQQHLGRLEGVDKVNVSLADGEVVIVAKEDSQLDPAKVFKATYDSGVSVVEMDIDATGTFEQDDKGHLMFRISGTQIYPVMENAIGLQLHKQPLPRKASVHARLFRKTGKQKVKALGTVQLEVLELQKEP
jgi:hypothetical protein